MKRYIAITLAAASINAQAAQFQEAATVVQSNPVYAQVQQAPVCRDVPVQNQQVQDRGIGGALVGIIAGGLLGSTIGNGSGRVAAAAVGAGVGGIVGDRVQNGGNNQTQMMRECTQQPNVQSIVGFDTTFQIGNRQMVTRTTNHFQQGQRVNVNVTVDLPQ